MKRGLSQSTELLAHWGRLVIAGLSLVGVLALRAGVDRSQGPEAVEAEIEGSPWPDDSGGLALDRLFVALSALENGSSTEPVRLLWLGDVQAAEATLVQVVRKGLQERFGDGGVGFLSMETGAERWPDVAVERQGQFRTVPSVRESVVVQSPGQWGLAGVGLTPTSSDAALVVQIASDAERKDAGWRFEWFYQFGSQGMAFELVDEDEATPVPVESSQSLRLSDGSYCYVHASAGSSRLRAQRFVGAPILLGVAAERSSPGVVVDRVGIRGARVATALAWEQEAWHVAVEHRDPALVVVAFGTDEIHQAGTPAETLEDLPELLARLQAAAPEADCLVVGPTFASSPAVPGGAAAAHLRYAEVAASKGCAFLSPWDARRPSGEPIGPSHFEPPVARGDGFRLSTLGYEIVGRDLVQRLLQSYDEWSRASTSASVRLE